MFGRRTATPANDADAIILNKVLVKLREFLRLQFVNSVAAFVLRKPSVGQNGNVFGRISAKIADGVVHLRRAGRAVHADDVYIERLKRSQRCANFGAEQHRARLLQRDLHLNG